MPPCTLKERLCCAEVNSSTSPLSSEGVWITPGCTNTVSNPGSTLLQSRIDWGGWSQDDYSFAVNYLLQGEREADDVWFIITDIQR